MAELKARDAERVAAIAKLEEALLQARTATPHATTPRRADSVVLDATPATRSLVSTPVTDPALIPPAQQAAAAMAAAASVAAITASAIAAGGGNAQPRSSETMVNGGIMPLAASPPLADERDDKKAKSKTMTADEHLATAALQLAQERNKLVVAKQKALKSSIANRIASVARGTSSLMLSKLAEATETWGVQQWAALLLAVTTARPWLQPLFTTVLRAVGTHLHGAMKDILDGGIWQAVRILIELRDRLKRRAISAATTAVTAPRAITIGRAAQALGEATSAATSHQATPTVLMLAAPTTVSSGVNMQVCNLVTADPSTSLHACDSVTDSADEYDEELIYTLATVKDESDEELIYTLATIEEKGWTSKSALVVHPTKASSKQEGATDQSRDSRNPLVKLRSLLLCMQHLRRTKAARLLEIRRRFLQGWNGRACPFIRRQTKARRSSAEFARQRQMCMPHHVAAQRLSAALVIQRAYRARADRLLHRLGEELLAGRDDSDSGDEYYDPRNLNCPDRVPGCLCGLAWSEDPAWRSEDSSVFSNGTELHFDADDECGFARPSDYDSDLELQEFFRVNDPTAPVDHAGVSHLHNADVVLMLSAGDKRSADSSLEQRDQEALRALVQAWIALEDAGLATDAHAELIELGSWLGVSRAQSTTHTTVATALGPYIWPSRYPRLADAIEIMNQGKHIAVTKIRYAALNRVVARLNGQAAVEDAVTAERARRSLTALAAAAASCAQVALILGTTGDVQRPVVVRLLVVPRSDASAATSSHRSYASCSRAMPGEAHGSSPGFMALCAPDESLCGSSAIERLSMLYLHCDTLWDEFVRGEDLSEWSGLLPYSRSRTPSPSLEVSEREQLMMVSESIWEYPPGTVSNDARCVPGLCDDGASYNAGCSRTLAGAILDTYSADGECRMGVGASDAGLNAKGSYIYVFERYGADGSGELVARRLRHTPELPVHIVFSEPSEVYGHQYKFVFTDKGRVMTTNTGKEIPLHMGTHTKLGWLKTVPVTDMARAKAVYAEMLASGRGGQLMTLGDGQPHSVGMPLDLLRGVALLRRKHAVNGHCSLRKLLAILKAEGIGSGLISRDDLREYAKQMCGACESAKQKRRAFTIQTLADHTVAPIGKKWIWDGCKLRIPSAEHGYVGIFLAVCDTSNKHFVCGLLGESAADYRRAHELLQAFNTPHHGAIVTVRGDSHPSHRAREFRDYCSSTGKELQLGPPYVHEASAAKSEVAFLVGVPTAVALLMGSADLGDAHQYSAFNTAIAAWDYAASHTADDGTVTSANMRYYGKKEWIANPLFVYGASCKALVHPEKRGDHWELHAVPAVYTGPALNSNSPIHCSVWCERYVDVDVGCMNIDERSVLARFDKAHSSHQPYNQDGAERVIESDTSVWYDAHTRVHPADVKLTAGDDLRDELPTYAPPLWTSELALPVSEFSLGVCSGVVRAGDLGSWLRMLTSGVHHHIRIDTKVGGYEHMVQRAHVLDALVALAGHPLNRCTVLQLPCGPWSKVKFEKDGGPRPIFTVQHPDGIPGEEHSRGVSMAMERVRAGVSIGTATLAAGNGAGE